MKEDFVFGRRVLKDLEGGGRVRREMKGIEDRINRRRILRREREPTP